MAIGNTIILAGCPVTFCGSTICTKSVVIAYKNSYKQPLYPGIPGVQLTDVLSLKVFDIWFKYEGLPHNIFTAVCHTPT